MMQGYMYTSAKCNQVCGLKLMGEKLVILYGSSWKVEGSVIDALCEYKGGRDGGCKHIAASMYSLDELLNQDGSKSVTSGPCLWMPKPQSSSEPCSVDHLEIIKIKPPSAKQRKRKYSWLQNIDFDPRSPKHQKVSTTKKSNILGPTSVLHSFFSSTTLSERCPGALRLRWSRWTYTDKSINI